MAPEAAAGPDQTVSLGETATLSAVGSDQKNGDALTYRWSIVSAPTGSAATLSDPASPAPTFTPDLIGEYVFQLVVDNDFHKSDPVQVKVICNPAPVVPVVNATDPSGLIVLQDLSAVENFRTATHVNLILKYNLKNSGTTRVSVIITVRGLNHAGVEVYAADLPNAVNAGETKPTSHSLGEVLTVAQFDAITSWIVDPVTVTQ